MPAIRAERVARTSSSSRDEYLQRHTLRQNNPRLCNVILGANQVVITMARKNQKRPGASPPKTRYEVPPGFPWLTPVLGSGALPNTGQEPERDPDLQRARLVELLASKEFETQDDGLVPSELCDRFLSSLIEDRLGRSTLSSPPIPSTDPSPKRQQSDGLPSDGQVANYALLAALLTRAYHLAKAWPPEAIGRWGSDHARLQIEERPASEPDLLVADIRRLLGDILSGSRAPGSLGTILEEVLHDINGLKPSLRLSRVRLVTEYVWYLLSRQRPPYPGWTDLLFELSLNHELSPDDGPGLPRPSFPDLRVPGGPVREAYEAVTERAWDYLMRDERTGQGTIHYAVAALLSEQSALRRAPKRVGHLPIASAFVTTFDLELEMALLARGQEFVIAFPVHVYTLDNEEEAHPRWLACHVVPDPAAETRDQLPRLRQPKHLFLLHDDDDHPFELLEADQPAGTTSERPRFADLPVVVRLSGCPLIDLPDLVSGERSERTGELLEQLRDSMDIDDDDSISLISHAVLLDEYTAMHQTTPDSQSEGASLASVFSVGAENLPRFWLVLGVQLRDSAVRQRLTSQIALASVNDRAKDRAVPTSSGVFVNRRLEPVHRDLLFWWGFDVVNSDCQEFTSEIEHLTEHVRNPYTPLAGLRNNECGLWRGDVG